MDNLPNTFLAHYECQCGEAYEMVNFHAPHLKLFCEECGQNTVFEFKYVEYRILKWETVRELWAKEGGLTFPDEGDN